VEKEYKAKIKAKEESKKVEQKPEINNKAEVKQPGVEVS
jgi:hypothetical protein